MCVEEHRAAGMFMSEAFARQLLKQMLMESMAAGMEDGLAGLLPERFAMERFMVHLQKN